MSVAPAGEYTPVQQISFLHFHSTHLVAETAFRYESSESQGATLISSAPVVSESCLADGFLLEYVKKHRHSWLEFARNTLGRNIKLDDIILVTGFEATRHYAMSAFSSRDSVKREFEFKLGGGAAAAVQSAWGSWGISEAPVFHNHGQLSPGIPQHIDQEHELQWLRDPSAAYSSKARLLEENGINHCIFVQGYTARERPLDKPLSLIDKVIAPLEDTARI